MELLLIVMSICTLNKEFSDCVHTIVHRARMPCFSCICWKACHTLSVYQLDWGLLQRRRWVLDSVWCFNPESSMWHPLSHPHHLLMSVSWAGASGVSIMYKNTEGLFFAKKVILKERLLFFKPHPPKRSGILKFTPLTGSANTGHEMVFPLTGMLESAFIQTWFLDENPCARILLFHPSILLCWDDPPSHWEGVSLYFQLLSAGRILVLSFLWPVTCHLFVNSCPSPHLWKGNP